MLSDIEWVETASAIADVPAGHGLALRDTDAGGDSGRRTDPTADFLDLHFEQSDQAGILAQIAARAATAPFAYVITPNVDHIVRLQYLRSDLWPAYRRAWLTLCDSRILGRLAAHDGLVLSVVPGSDLTMALLRDVIGADDDIAILGGSAEAVAALCHTYGLTHVTHYNPPMGFINDTAEIARAAQFLVGAHARYSFLAVGSPQQEVLAYHVARTGGASGVGFCIGASLDFLTNRQIRAPRLMQRLSLEWLFRLLADPMRLWRRYLIDGPLIFAIHHSWQKRRARLAR